MGKFVKLAFKMRAPYLLLSMLLVPQFVNGAELAVQASTATTAFESVIRRVTSQGEDAKFAGMRRFPQIPKGAPTKAEWAFSKSSEDGHRRQFSVILDLSTATIKGDLVELYVEHKDKPARKSQEFYFLVGLDETLKEGGTAEGPLDEKGKVIRSAAFAPFKYLDIKSPETRALFQREFNFWVKGIGRKAPVGAQTPEKKP